MPEQIRRKAHSPMPEATSKHTVRSLSPRFDLRRLVTPIGEGGAFRTKVVSLSCAGA